MSNEPKKITKKRDATPRYATAKRDATPRDATPCDATAPYDTETQHAMAAAITNTMLRELRPYLYEAAMIAIRDVT